MAHYKQIMLLILISNNYFEEAKWDAVLMLSLTRARFKTHFLSGSIACSERQQLIWQQEECRYLLELARGGLG